MKACRTIGGHGHTLRSFPRRGGKPDRMSRPLEETLKCFFLWLRKPLSGFVTIVTLRPYSVSERIT